MSPHTAKRLTVVDPGAAHHKVCSNSSHDISFELTHRGFWPRWVFFDLHNGLTTVRQRIERAFSKSDGLIFVGTRQFLCTNEASCLAAMRRSWPLRARSAAFFWDELWGVENAGFRDHQSRPIHPWHIAQFGWVVSGFGLPRLRAEGMRPLGASPVLQAGGEVGAAITFRHHDADRARHAFKMVQCLACAADGAAIE